jgi:hypothetical protein
MILLLNLEFLLGFVFRVSIAILPSLSSSFSLKGFLKHLLLKVLGLTSFILFKVRSTVEISERRAL